MSAPIAVRSGAPDDAPGVVQLTNGVIAEGAARGQAVAGGRRYNVVFVERGL